MAALVVAAAPVPAYIEVMDTLSDTRGGANFDEILADFELLDDWEDRYRYVIELGRRLAPLPLKLRNPDGPSPRSTPAKIRRGLAE